MENKQIALSDVERNKELFEYEMTEVILQLKGEFAKVSGKDMKLDNSQLSVPSVNIGTVLPSVKLDPISMETQAAVTISGEKLAIPPVAIEKTSIDCPTVPAVSATSIENVALEKTQLDCSVVNAQVTINDAPVSIELPNVPKIETGINLPSINGTAKIDNNAISNISMAEIPSMSITLPSAVEVSRITVDIPQTAIDVQSSISSTQCNVLVDVPNVPTVAQYSDTVVSVQKTKEQIEVRKPAEYIHKEVDVSMPSVEVANASITPQATMKDVALQDTPIDLPKVSNIGVFEIKPVTANSEPISIPTVQTIGVPMPAPVTTQKISLNDDVAIPEINISNASSTTVKIEKANVNYEYSTVHSVAIPDIDIQKIEGVEVPKMPDFSDAIRDVLESAV